MGELYEIEPKNVLYEDTLYTVIGYRSSCGKQYAEAYCMKDNRLEKVECCEMKERLFQALFLHQYRRL